MSSIFSTAVILFAVFALSRAFLRFKGKQISIAMLLTWIVVWGGVIVAATVPGIIDFFAVFFGTRTADLVIFIALLFNFYMMFKLYVRLEKTNQDITEVVRKVAIYTAEKKVSS